MRFRRCLPAVVGCSCLVVLILAGCGQNTPQGSGGTNPPPVLQIPASNTPPAVLRQPTPDELHDAALLEALNKMTDREYDDALLALERAKAAKDSKEVQQQIEKVKALLAQRQAMEKTADDIQIILNDGKPEEAAKLINAALTQYGGSQDSERLLKLKRQADALFSTTLGDQNTRRKRFEEEAETALRDNNLRGAAASYDQALAGGEDQGLKQKAEEVRGKITQYDECVKKAGELRRDPLQWEEALTQYETAAKAWETPQVRQDIADMQLALQKRRPRLGVADFEMRGDVGVPLFGKTVSEELLGGFKIRYDLVERSQLSQVVDELKLQSSALIADQDGRREVGRLAKLQFMVVGSVSPISGVTVNARLIDVRTGLIVQTGKISAPTPEEAVKLLPQLAQILMMSDEEKTAFEKQLAEQAAAVPPPPPAQETMIPPPPPQATQQQPPPAPVVTTTNRPPEMGNLKPGDFDRIPAMPMPGQPVVQPPAQEVILVQEQPVRQRMLAIQLELGDNLYRRGRYQEAHFHFMMAREIAPTETAVLVRIDNVQPYIPPPPPVTVIVIQPPPPPRERVAVMNFLYSGDPMVVPPFLSTWTPDQLAPYFCPPFDVVDRTELYWYMARMGLTVSDVMNNPSARRWLARALRVRYFVFGQIQQTNSFLVTTHMVDAETGCLTGRGCVHARNQFELKCQLGDLARETLSPPRPTVVVVQQAEQRSRATVDIHIALGKGDFELALTLTNRARADRRDYAELAILQQRAEAGRQAAILQQERERQWAKIQYERDKIAKEQMKFQAEAARQAAILQEERVRQGAKFAQEQAKRQAQVDTAVMDLINRARVARNLQNYPLSIQFMESAVSLKPTPEIRRELAEIKTQADQAARRHAAEAAAVREKRERQQHEAELARTREQLARQQQQQLVADRERISSREKLDYTEYQRLIDRAQALHAKGNLDEALATAQSAKHLRKTDEVEGLINSYSVELARKQATAKGDKERQALEQRLAQEKTRREAAERLAKENQGKYEAALKLAQEAMAAKKYEVAVSRYQDAAKVIRTDEALSGQKAAELALAENRKASEALNRKAEEERQKGQRLAALKAKGKAARDNKQFAAAIQAYQDALKLTPDDVELRTEIEEIRSEQEKATLANRTQRPESKQINPIKPTEPSPAVAEQQQKKREYEAAMAKGKAALNANKFDEAITHFQKARDLMPSESDPGTYLATAERKRDQARPKPVDTVAQQRQQEAEARRLQIAQLLTKARQALQAKRLDEAEQGFNEVLKVEPNNQAALQGRQTVATERDAVAKANEAAKEQQQFQKHIQDGKTALQGKNFDAAVQAFEQAAQLRPNNTEAKTQLAQARQMQQQAKAASEKAENDRRMAEQKQRQVTDLIAKGQAAMQAKDYAKAENFFNEVLKVEPNNQAAQQGKRDAFTAARAKAQSDADAQKAAQAKAHVQQYLDAGKAALRAKKYDEAIQQFEQALKLDADNREVLTLINQAKQEKQRAGKPMTPNRPDPNAQRQQQVMQHITQAKSHFQNKKYNMAIQEYQQALRLDPDNQEAKAGLTQAQNAQRDSQAGNQQGQPGQGDPYAKHMQTARGLEQQQRWKAAADAYKQALQARPGDQQATSALKNAEFQMYMNQGKSLLQSGKKKEAADAFAAALQRFPNHPEATKLLNQAKSGK